MYLMQILKYWQMSNITLFVQFGLSLNLFHYAIKTNKHGINLPMRKVSIKYEFTRKQTCTACGYTLYFQTFEIYRSLSFLMKVNVESPSDARNV